MKNGPVITITMNPAIDKSARVDKIVPEAKLRCTAVKNEAGGGGINVSKALGRLGLNSTAVFPAGGHNGNLLQDLLKKQEIQYHSIQVSAETRENFVILETLTNDQYRFNMEAAPLDAGAALDCLAILKALPVAPAIVVVSGSLPQGIPENFYADLARWAVSVSAKFILDSSGAPLRSALQENIFLIKPNLAELGQIAGEADLAKENVVKAARKVIAASQCEVIVVSLGADGACLITKDQQVFVKAPDAEKKSTVGAGDSMVAGMVYQLYQEKPLEEMVRFGVACGTAATMNAGTELFHVNDVNRLFDEINRVL